MMMCAWMGFCTIRTALQRAFQRSRASHRDLLTVKISTVLMMVGLLYFVECKTVERAANSSSKKHLKIFPCSLIESTLVVFLAGPWVVATAKPPCFYPSVVKPSVYIM